MSETESPLSELQLPRFELQQNAFLGLLWTGVFQRFYSIAPFLLLTHRFRPQT